MKNILYVEKRNFVSSNKHGIKAVNIVDKSEQYFAYEDVGMIIFDNVQSYFSEKLIRKCVQHNIVLLFCDEQHSPLLLLDNVYGQSRRFKILGNQISLPAKAKGRIWHKIVVAKIENQARCLELLERPKDEVGLIRSSKKNVVNNDEHNTEAYAARMYFQYLFGKGFKRGRYDDLINASLNYGYAVLRMLIRKEIVAHGLEPSFGVNHISEENPFNLSDDLIEAYRPIVDLWIIEQVLNSASEVDNELTLERKQMIIRVLLEKCVIADKVYHLGDAIKLTVDSYLNCLTTKSASGLKLPSFIEGGW